MNMAGKAQQAASMIGKGGSSPPTGVIDPNLPGGGGEGDPIGPPSPDQVAGVPSPTDTLGTVASAVGGPYGQAATAGMEMIQGPQQAAQQASMGDFQRRKNQAWSSPEYLEWANSFWGG